MPTRWRSGTLALSGVGAHAPAPWRNRHEDPSSRNTTEWDELRTVS